MDTEYFLTTMYVDAITTYIHQEYAASKFDASHQAPGYLLREM